MQIPLNLHIYHRDKLSRCYPQNVITQSSSSKIGPLPQWGAIQDVFTAFISIIDVFQALSLITGYKSDSNW